MKLKLTAFLWNPLILCFPEDMGIKKLWKRAAGENTWTPYVDSVETEHTLQREFFSLWQLGSNKNLVTFTFLLFRLEGLGVRDALIVHIVVVQMEYGAGPGGLDEMPGRLFILQCAAPLWGALPVQAGFRHSHKLPLLLAVGTRLRLVPGWKAIFWRVEKHEMTSIGIVRTGLRWRGLEGKRFLGSLGLTAFAHPSP